MIRFLTSSIICATALSGFAHDNFVSSSFTMGQFRASRAVPSTNIVPSVQHKKNVLRLNKAPEAELTLEDFVGEYEWYYNDLLGSYDGYSVGVLSVTIDPETPNTIILNGCVNPEYKVAPIRATVDLENNTVSVPNMQNLGYDLNNDLITFYIKDIQPGSQMSPGVKDVEASVGTIEDGLVVFPDLDIWAWGDPEDEQTGWWNLTVYNMLNNLGDPDEGWEDWGRGTFADGWMLPAADMDPFTNKYTVSIQRSTAVEGVYRIFNPYYGSFPLSAQFGGPGYIIFDIIDRDFVCVIPYVRAGFHVSGMSFCCTNLSGFFVANDYSKEEIMAQWPDNEWSKYQDGTVYFNDCYLNVQDQDGYLQWEDCTIPMKGSLTFDKLPLEYENDAVESLTSDNYQTLYFNAFGERVDPDTKGLVITRCGAKTEKIFVR